MIWSLTEQRKLPLVSEVLFHLTIYLKKTTKVCFYRLFPISPSLKVRQGGTSIRLPPWEKAHRLLLCSVMWRCLHERDALSVCPHFTFILGDTGEGWLNAGHFLDSFPNYIFVGWGVCVGEGGSSSWLLHEEGCGTSFVFLLTSQILLLGTGESTSLVSNPWRRGSCKHRVGCLRNNYSPWGLAKQWEEGLLPLPHPTVPTY